MFQAVNVLLEMITLPSIFDLGPGLNDEGRLAVRFGLQNESKLNLNVFTVLENSPAGMLVSAVSGSTKRTNQLVMRPQAIILQYHCCSRCPG